MSIIDEERRLLLRQRFLMRSLIVAPTPEPPGPVVCTEITDMVLLNGGSPEGSLTAINYLGSEGVAWSTWSLTGGFFGESITIINEVPALEVVYYDNIIHTGIGLDPSMMPNCIGTIGDVWHIYTFNNSANPGEYNASDVTYTSDECGIGSAWFTGDPSYVVITS